nr:unnamed protein product [Spirometra erinaceieuropaei]
MRSEELQRLTASEPLTLAEEYAQQKNWLEKNDRVTFILLDKARLPPTAVDLAFPTQPETSTVSDVCISPLISDLEVEAMIGDVNFYLIPAEEAESGGASDLEDLPSPATGLTFEGEVSVMIAEPTARGRGLAAQAIAACLLYVHKYFTEDITAVVAKVSLDNEASLRLFRDKLGFVERKRVLCFNEVDLVYPAIPDSKTVAADTASRIISHIEKSGRPWNFLVFAVDVWRERVFFQKH